jgi:hypothetical protein
MEDVSCKPWWWIKLLPSSVFAYSINIIGQKARVKARVDGIFQGQPYASAACLNVKRLDMLLERRTSVPFWCRVTIYLVWNPAQRGNLASARLTPVSRVISIDVTCKKQLKNEKSRKASE